jgi:hypothetical protein
VRGKGERRGKPVGEEVWEGTESHPAHEGRRKGREGENPWGKKWGKERRATRHMRGEGREEKGKTHGGRNGKPPGI